MPDIDRSIYKGGIGEVVEKKSRFIATIEPVTNKEEAEAMIAACKKKYWDARHNCHAFVIGNNNELTRCSDDGEPSGIAVHTLSLIRLIFCILRMMENLPARPENRCWIFWLHRD